MELWGPWMLKMEPLRVCGGRRPGMSGPMRPKARGLAQHGGPSGWLERRVTQRVWFCTLCTLINKKIKLSSYIRKFRMEQLQSHIWGRAGNAQIFPHIWGSRWSYMTLQLLHSEFPYIWGKFDFLFYQCTVHNACPGRIKPFAPDWVWPNTKCTQNTVRSPSRKEGMACFSSRPMPEAIL